MAKKASDKAELQTQQLVTAAELAERLGITRHNVLSYVSRKVIVYADVRKKLLDPVECETAIRTVQAMSGKTDQIIGLAGAQTDADSSGGGLQSMAERLTVARVQREEADAELKRLKAAQLRGELVAVSDLQDALVGLGRVLRERLLAIPPRLGPVLAAEPRAVRCSLAVQQEITAALAEFTDSIPTLIASVAKASADDDA